MRELNLIIRRAGTADANVLAGLGAQTFVETFNDDNTPEDMAAYLATSFSVTQLTVELAEPSSTFFIAEVDDSPSGYAKIQSGTAAPGIEGNKPIELVRLYVAQRWLGHGVGQALMQRCLEEAREMGFETIWLGVWEHNHRAQAFYRKWNFHEVGEHIFQLGSDRQRDILLERLL